ncbi:MAG: hypothetical protein WBF17_04240 [Phycisphaerae bacterium]
MARRDLEATDPKRLAEVMDLGSQESVLWEPEELDAILRHQLAARVEAELSILDEGLAPKLAATCAKCVPPIATFNDLFHHPNPPVALLELTKQFARACKDHPDHPLPSKIGAVLYLASIVVARLRCAALITKMDDRTLCGSLTWAIGQEWLDDSLRGLLRDGLRAVSARDGS